jgi:hypothetical protein
MSRHTDICPKCSFRLRPSDAHFAGPYFECPSCKQKLRIPPSYRRFLLAGQVVISIALPYMLGIRDVLAFIIVALIAFFPVVFLFTLLMRNIYPPRFEPYAPADMSLRQITKNDP